MRACPADGDFQAAEGGGTDDVLERFAQAAAPDEFPQGIGFRRGQHAVEIEVQFHARQLEQMRQEQFRVQARRTHLFFAEKFRAFLDGFENGHAGAG